MNSSLENNDWGNWDENETTTPNESFSWEDDSNNSEDNWDVDEKYLIPQEHIESKVGEGVDGLLKGINEDGEEWEAAVYSNPEYTVHGLFPIPVATLKVPNTLLAKSYPFLKKAKYLNKNNSNTDSDYSGDITEDKYLLNNPELEGLHKFLGEQVQWFNDEILKLNTGGDTKITQSWITKKGNTQNHQKHCHSNSVISGALFLGNLSTPPEGLPPLIFHLPQDISFGRNDMFLMAPGLGALKNDEINEFSAKEFFVAFEPGTLILFPSTLYHSVPENTTNTERLTLSFNSIPSSLGDAMNLNEVKITS